jgi:hypothetical protein
LYEYALTEEGGIRIEARRNQDSVDKLTVSVIIGESVQELNQMRYISRQLRHETRAIALQMKDVHFHTRPRRSLNMFLLTCSPTV